MAEEKGLETLQVWQKSIAIAVKIYQQVIVALPIEEKWNLAAQLRRSVQSISANIAEGFGRYHYLDNIRYCYFAGGSLEETYSHITLANNLGYLPKDLFNDIKVDLDELRRVLNGNIVYLKKSKRGEHEPGGKYRIQDDIPMYPYDLDAEGSNP